MTVWYFEALAGIALSLSILMALAWMVQQRTGNSGWVDTTWTFSVGLTGAGSALWPAGAAPNRGWLCEVGLWRWSRHPTYFLEWFGWRAYPVIAISTDYCWGWPSLLARVLMYWILVHVPGIPPLEAQMLRSRGERYRTYQS